MNCDPAVHLCDECLKLWLNRAPDAPRGYEWQCRRCDGGGTTETRIGAFFQLTNHAIESHGDKHATCDAAVEGELGLVRARPEHPWAKGGPVDPNELVPALLDGSYVVPRAALRKLGGAGHDEGCMCARCGGTGL